jgi:hypothetical protein
MSLITDLGQEFGQYLIQLTSELFLRPEQPRSLSEIERGIREMLMKVGQFLLISWLAMQTNKYPEKEIECSYCGAEAEYQYQRPGTLLTILGQVSYKRAYYVCPYCRQGQYPLDMRLGLRPGQISAELESLSGMTGIQMPFEQSSQLFEALTLVSLSDHSIAKSTQAMGYEMQVQEAEWQAQSQNEEWLQEQERIAEHPKRLYGALDAAKVHIRGEKGAEKDPWKDLKVGAWFTTKAKSPQNPDDDWKIEAQNMSYYCDILPSQQFGELLWATGCQHRAQLAEELIFLGDGAEWIWNQVNLYYPHAIQIVDWFHATEYIAPIANAAFSEEDQRQDWISQVRSDLWEGELTSVIRACQRFSDHPKAGEPARSAVTYFTNNQHRMDYPAYRAKGYQIGSGTIESACKQIVTQRLKVAGAIWELDNAVKTAKARAAWLSNQWPDLVARRERSSLPLAA